MKQFLFILFTLLCLTTHATNYYLSNNGDDGKSGKSDKLSWKTIDRLNKQRLRGGDTVFFKRNDIFSGQVLVQYSGTPISPIVYTAYGYGNTPLFTGASIFREWVRTASNVMESATVDSVYFLFVNGELQTKARYPNKGFLSMDGGVGNKVSFFDEELKQQDNHWVGASIRFRTWDWEFRNSIVTNFSNSAITIRDSSTNILAKGWGYYFDNLLSELDTCREWFFDPAVSKLYYIPSNDEEPENSKFEGVVDSVGFLIEKGIDNVLIKEIAIEKYGSYGILAKGQNKNIKIINNKFENIGLTAIRFELLSRSCSVSNNSINNIFGTGISALEPDSLIVQKNTIRNVGAYPGYGINGVNGMVAIAIENIEERKSETSHVASNNYILDNIIDSIGYVGIRMDGRKSLMEYNLVSNTLLQLSDGSAVYCWAKDGDYYTYDNIIRNNIVFNISGNNQATPNLEDPIANGIYVDNYCYNILVLNNVVFNVTGSGIHINSGAYKNQIIGNSVINCSAAISIAEWLKPSTTFGNSFQDNFLCIKEKKHCFVALTNWLLPSTKEFGYFDKNIYVDLTGEFSFTETFMENKSTTRVVKEHSFDAWKEQFGYDLSGKFIDGKNASLKFKDPVVVFNATHAAKAYDFTEHLYYNYWGVRITEIKLDPFKAVILFKK